MHIASARVLPGVSSPAAGFGQPFEMLDACHERLVRTLGLLERLLEHLDTAGADRNGRSAAGDVWRYFELAAPQHHRDEELHLIPRLLTSDQPGLVAAGQRMLIDHQNFRVQWHRLGPALAALRDGDPPPRSVLLPLAQAFIARHGEHLALEDGLVFPALRSGFTPTELQAMGTEMARRRGVTVAVR